MSTLDAQKVDRFTETALGDLKGSCVITLAGLGDRLGLFRELARGAATSDELAGRTGCDERYLREWLAAMTCAGYVEHDPDTERFTLPPEHARVLADETSPVFFGGLYQEMPALWEQLGPLERHMREGGGLCIRDYGRDWWDGMERFTATWFQNFLLQEWIPRAGDVKQRLEKGARLADVGCGRGRALIELARAFPGMRGVGFDLVEANLEGARKNAGRAGVADRLTFDSADVHEGLPGRFDVITTFDAVHDFKDPQAAFRSIHDALTDDGVYLLLEFRVGDRLEDNIGPIGAMFYSWSLMYCMTTSLAMGGKGLGTCGMPESVVRATAAQAGFSSVEIVPFDSPFNVVYLARK